MRNSGRLLLIAFLGLIGACPAVADQEASNVAHVATGPFGRCYAKSVPMHVYDPADEPRQQGVTKVYRVGDTEDALVHTYDWFSQRLFIRCSPTDGIAVARLGPWHRGHDAHADPSPSRQRSSGLTQTEDSLSAVCGVLLSDESRDRC